MTLVVLSTFFYYIGSAESHEYPLPLSIIFIMFLSAGSLRSRETMSLRHYQSNALSITVLSQNREFSKIGSSPLAMVVPQKPWRSIIPTRAIFKYWVDYNQNYYYSSSILRVLQEVSNLAEFCGMKERVICHKDIDRIINFYIVKNYTKVIKEI